MNSTLVTFFGDVYEYETGYPPDSNQLMIKLGHLDTVANFTNYTGPESYTVHLLSTDDRRLLENFEGLSDYVVDTDYRVTISSTESKNPTRIYMYEKTGATTFSYKRIVGTASCGGQTKILYCGTKIVVCTSTVDTCEQIGLLNPLQGILNYFTVMPQGNAGYTIYKDWWRNAVTVQGTYYNVWVLPECWVTKGTVVETTLLETSCDEMMSTEAYTTEVSTEDPLVHTTLLSTEDTTVHATEVVSTEDPMADTTELHTEAETMGTSDMGSEETTVYSTKVNTEIQTDYHENTVLPTVQPTEWSTEVSSMHQTETETEETPTDAPFVTNALPETTTASVTFQAGKHLCRILFVSLCNYTRTPEYNGLGF